MPKLWKADSAKFIRRISSGKGAIFLIMLLGLILRLKGLFAPLMDLYIGKQEYCAMMARNYFRHGYKLFYPEVDWFGAFDSTFRLEFPLISYITALLYSVFGIHEVLGRLVCIAFSLGSVYLIFKLSEKLFNRRTAIYAGFLFAVSPLGVYFGRVFMSDTLMIFFLIASLYYFMRWLETEYRFHYILAFIFGLLAFLNKFSALHICLPMVYLAYLKYKKGIFRKPAIYLFFLGTILLAQLWYINGSLRVVRFVGNNYNLSLLVQPVFYRRILESLSLLILTPIGAFLALLGFGFSVKSRERYLLQVWLIAVIINTFVAAGQNYIHYYYQLPFVPIFCILAAKAMDRSTDSEIWSRTLFSRINPRIIIAFIMVSILAMGYMTVTPFYKWSRESYRASKLLNALTEKDAIIVFGRCAYQDSLYYTDRKGWQTNAYPVGSLAYSWSVNLDQYNFPERDKNGIIPLSEVKLIEFLIKHGADYYFTTNMEALRNEPEFRAYLYDNFKVLKETGDFVIFDLRKK